MGVTNSGAADEWRAASRLRDAALSAHGRRSAPRRPHGRLMARRATGAQRQANAWRRARLPRAPRYRRTLTPLTALRHWRNSQTAWAYAPPSPAARWLQLTVLARRRRARMGRPPPPHGAAAAPPLRRSPTRAPRPRLLCTPRSLLPPPPNALGGARAARAAATAHHRRAACARCVATGLQHAARHTAARRFVAMAARRVETRHPRVEHTICAEAASSGCCDTLACPSNRVPPAAPPTRGVRRRRAIGGARARRPRRAALVLRSQRRALGSWSTTRARRPATARLQRAVHARERRASCAGGQPGGTRRWRARTLRS